MRTILKEGPPPIKSALEDWTTRDGLLFYKNRCYVPNKGNLRREIVKTIHKAKGIRHPGQFNTLEQVTRDYWWPGMARFVKMFIDGCVKCQESKVITHPNKAPLLPIEGEKDALPFSKITMDLITDLPDSNRHDMILVVVDHSSTKGVIFTPCNKTIDTEQTAMLLLNNVYKRFGLPNKIISDRDPHFAAKVFQELEKQLGVKHMMSTAFHPQTDGESERVNQELEVFLRLFCSRQQDKWAELLPFTEFAHNNRTHSTMKKSPFYLMMGYNPRPLPMAFMKTMILSIETRLSELKRLQEETYSLMELARRKMEGTAKRSFTPFTVGQKVWLEGKNLNFGYPSKKLAPKREGPFKIKSVLGPVTYKLTLPEQWKVHPVFHASLLSPYKRNEVHGRNFLKPPPDLIEGQEEHEIDAIVRHTPKRKPQRFLVSWKGYPSAENEWLREEDFKHAKETLADYKKANKLRQILTKAHQSKCLNLTPTTTCAPPPLNSSTSSITPLTERGSSKPPATPRSSTISSEITSSFNNSTSTSTAASGFMIPGQLTITPLPAGERHLPQADWNILLDLPWRPLRTMSSSNIPEPRPPPPSQSTVSIQTGSIDQNHLRVLSPDLPQTPPPQPEFPRPQNPSPDPSNSASNLAQRSRRSPSPEPNSTEPLPHPLVSLSQSLQTTTPRTPGLPGIGMLQQTRGTPPPGLSVPSPPNSPPLPENNDDAATTDPERPTSSSAPSPISIPEFLNAINAVGGVTIYRTVETTSVQSATHTNLIISLNIPHNYDEANEFLLHGLLGVIQLLMALRRTTLIPPPSPTSPTSPTPTEEEEEAPPVYTIVHITDDREPIMVTTDDGEERTFVLVRYVNGATVFEAGTSNQNRG
ncbi:retrotransposon nucleocapsid protein [Moniliophthora roreri MCA 2997]|uniref:Retrotransposon nucleocapsid protein n=1 Tax=Moniliophthora roreri (strain MCA 2997) TaxID=1381753 RepID=V2WGN5_MONRO|nr:retrotransposon nucleocapsid protein [Moniliophthora roreri MCA 2997]